MPGCRALGQRRKVRLMARHAKRRAAQIDAYGPGGPGISALSITCGSSRWGRHLGGQGPAVASLRGCRHTDDVQSRTNATAPLSRAPAAHLVAFCSRPPASARAIPGRCARRRWRRSAWRRPRPSPCSPSRSRTPPAAFTPISSPTTRRIKRDVGRRGAAGPKPGGGLHEVGARRLRQRARRDLLLVGQQRRLDDHLAHDAGLAARRGDGLDVALDEPQVARLQRADVDHHVDLAGAVEDRPPRLVVLRVRRRRAEREADDRADAHARCLAAGARKRPPRSGSRRRWRTRTRAASRHSVSISWPRRIGLEQRVIDHRGHTPAAAPPEACRPRSASRRRRARRAAGPGSTRTARVAGAARRRQRRARRAASSSTMIWIEALDVR